MYFVTKCNNAFAYKVSEIEEVKEPFAIYDEKFVTDTFGTGNKSFLCIACGRHASSVLAIIHADNVNDALKLRDSYYEARIKVNDIIFTSLYEIKEDVKMKIEVARIKIFPNTGDAYEVELPWNINKHDEASIDAWIDDNLKNVEHWKPI